MGEGADAGVYGRDGDGTDRTGAGNGRCLSETQRQAHTGERQPYHRRREK